MIVSDPLKKPKTRRKKKTPEPGGVVIHDSTTQYATSTGVRSPKPGACSPKPSSIQGILLLLSEGNLSPATEWYVGRLAEVYDEIAEGKSPKVKLEILQELRDFIIPAEDRTPQKEIHDPAVDGLLRMTGSE